MPLVARTLALRQMAQFIAMLRQLFFNHKVSVADPHSHINKWYFECYGREYNYTEINERLKAYYDRLKHPDSPHTSVWDEVTQYDENCNSEESKRFLKSILSDVRKPPEFPILLSHNNTLSTLGGGKGGVKKMQITGLPELELRATRDRLGNIKPTYCGILTNTNEQGEMVQQAIIVEPDWMNVDYLLRKFPYLSDGHSAASNNTQIQGQPRSQILQNIDLDKKPIDVDIIDGNREDGNINDSPSSSFPVKFEEISETQAIKHISELTGLSEDVVNAVIQALRKQESESEIVQNIMGYKGRKYQKGKNFLATIKEFL
ncbi:MAG: hypothetical protein AAFO04_29045 [Cyanobacteria bacterium J06592_8]